MTRPGEISPPLGRRTIAIVGGGFCGCALATRLLRSAMRAPADILLVERDALIGRGVAYAPRTFPYLLNVPAGQMSADPRRPAEFFDFARKKLPDVTATHFVPRSLYGEYLEDRLGRAEQLAKPGVRLVRVRGNVTRIAPIASGTRWRLELRDGPLLADDVVLTLGNAPPAPLKGTESLRGSEFTVLDPWSALENVPARHSVLLVGTGLTMVDVATSLHSVAGERPALHALSRRGLLPRSHECHRRSPAGVDVSALVSASRESLRALTNVVRTHSLHAGARSQDWRDVIDTVRLVAPAVWQRLSVRDRARFLRHLRPMWDAHRHRLPAEVSARLDHMRAAGVLTVHAGRIESASIRGGRIRVLWSPRGRAGTAELVVDRVVNCTGPDHSLHRSREPFIRSLFEAGLISADPFRLGLRTSPDGHVLDASGKSVRDLYYIGPLLRATYWEATAVPELRKHVESTAVALVDRDSRGDAATISQHGAYAVAGPAA